MKTLILNGSPRKGGDTDFLIQLLTQHISGEVLTVSAFFDHISPCIDCRHCWQKPGCALKDKMQSIYPYLESCHNVVVATPIWFSSVSGPLLDLASRLQTYYCGRTFRKTPVHIHPKNGAVILTGAEPGTEKIPLKLSSTILKHCNASTIHPPILSLDTTNIPANQDQNAMEKISEMASLFNTSYQSLYSIE